MNFQITISTDPDAWDAYVISHPKASLYHLWGWLGIIKKTYGHTVYSLVATEHDGKGRISGVLPLVHINHLLFGKRLVSIPFFDMGGVLAETPEAEKTLIDYALRLARQIGVSGLELRQTSLCRTVPEEGVISCRGNELPTFCYTRTHKVRMLLDLPGSAETLLKSFKSKLRSQIKRPIKEGLRIKSGGAELVDEFYEVFLVNMRDLGSPVHSKRMFRNVLREFPDRSRIFVVHKDGLPLAAAVTVMFDSVLENPWASALRRYNHLSPNMLLYWGMLEYAADNGFSKFDFGRSTPGEGTYKFKEQWGAKPQTLNWLYLSFERTSTGNTVPEDAKFKLASEIWKRLPVPLTRALGPRIRKYISL